MASLFFVCGQPSGPIADTKTFYADFLSTCIVNSMTINNVPINCIYAPNVAPDFNHYPNQRLVVKNTGNFILNDKIEVDFTPLVVSDKVACCN